MNLIKDIYYQVDYASLYLKEEEELFEFDYQEGGFRLYNLAIKRPIKKIGNTKVDEGYYDLETAYGYGGLYANTTNVEFITKALESYQIKCKQEKIIAEFIRFHPFNEFHNENVFFDFLLDDRKTISVDTSRNKEERWKSYASKTRTILRKCERELRMEKSNDITGFLDLYRQTMDRNDADHYYYFNEEYFQSLIKLDDIELYNIYMNDILVASSFFLFSENFGHYHLSANNYEYRKYNANYYILDQIFEYAHKRGIRHFHLGGGRTNNSDDLLLKFKKKFSNFEKKFYIAGKVFDKEKYDEYTRLWEKENPNNDIKYFLKYRL